VDAAAVERALALAVGEGGEEKQADLVDGAVAVRQGASLVLVEAAVHMPCESWPQITAGAVVPLVVPGETRLLDGWYLRADWVKLPEEIIRPHAENRLEWSVFLDVPSGPALALNLRTPRPGDRFIPLGMNGSSQKLSDFFVNQKVPRLARAGWPLLVCGDEIAWVVGKRLDERYQLSKTSESSLRIGLGYQKTES